MKDFRLIFLMMEDFQIKLQLLFFSPEKNLKKKIENRDSKFCLEFDADSKTVLVFLLALMVFDFYLFVWKLPKKYPSKNMKIVIFSKTKSKIKKFSRIKCDLFSILHMLCKISLESVHKYKIVSSKGVDPLNLFIVTVIILQDILNYYLSWYFGIARIFIIEEILLGGFLTCRI